MTAPRTITRRQAILGAMSATALSLLPGSMRVASAAERYTVTSDGLRLRSGPGLGFGVVASLARGTTVELIGWAGTVDGYTWANVSVPSLGRSGYVASTYIAPAGTVTPPPSGGTFPIGTAVRVSVSGGGNANLRAGPGLRYTVVRVVASGTTGTVQSGETAADGYRWVQVTLAGTTGYIATFLLVAGTGTPPPPPPSSGGTFPIGSTVRVSTTSGSAANMRSGPGMSYTVVRIVPNGTTGTVQSGETAADGYRWVMVTMGGSTGYMATSLLVAASGTVTPPPSGGTFPIGSTVHVATASGVRANMRSGAGLGYGVIATFAGGTTGTVQSGETAADGYRWVQVTMAGVSGWMATSVLASGAGTTGELWIDVNLSTQYMRIYRGDVVIDGTYVSTGRAGFATPTGTFSIVRKMSTQTMSGVIGGEYYYVPNVPWVMYFTNNGHAIHGAYWHDNFGTPMSHGCVNAPVGFAEWLYSITPLGTRVRIHY